YLPKIKEDTRPLVVHDEMQFLGDEFSGSFQSMSSSSDESPRPLQKIFASTAQRTFTSA
ncbi:hypothetical protein BGX26_005354, partial [Mortierella sp. AD094]